MLPKSFLINKGSSSVKERGQALAETAIVTIFLLLLLSLIVDGGRAMFTYLALQNAAGEGAYYAASFPTNEGTVGGTDKDTIIYRTQHESPSVLLDWTKPGSNVWVEFDPPLNGGQPQAGDIVIVTISYPFEFVGPLPGLLGFPNQIPIVARAVQVVLAVSNQN